MRSQLKKRKRKFFSPQDLKHGPLKPKTSVQPMSYADPLLKSILIKDLPYHPGQK